MNDKPLPREAETVSWSKLVDDLRLLISDGEGLLKSLAGDMSEAPIDEMKRSLEDGVAEAFGRGVQGEDAGRVGRIL